MTINTLHPIPYGASELKASYNRNLAWAFLLAIALFVAGLALYGLLGSTRGIIRPLVLPHGRIIVDPIPSGNPGEPGGHTSGGRTSGGSGGGRSAGTKGSQDPHGSGPITGGLPLPGSMPNGGFDSAGQDPNGSKLGGGGDSLDGTGTRKAPNSTPSKVPASFDNDADLPNDTFVTVEKYPVYDEEQLGRILEYPEMARRAGMEGDVVVRVLIDRTGRPIRTMIDQSNSPVFVAAAVKAVRSILYTPAIQNNLPVAVWIQIPVSFKLNR